MSKNTASEDMDYNPYAMPSDEFGYASAGDGSEAERIRKELISHEASIHSIGVLYLIGAVFGTIVGIFLAVAGVAAINQNGAPDATVGLLMGVFVTGLSIGQGFVGFGLRRLQSWTRIPVGILSGIGLIGFPLGTLINGYILYLIFGKKGSRVFTPEYQEIIRKTPHIKYKTSIIVKIFLILLLVLIGLGILAAVFAAVFAG